MLNRAQDFGLAIPQTRPQDLSCEQNQILIMFCADFSRSSVTRFFLVFIGNWSYYFQRLEQGQRLAVLAGQFVSGCARRAGIESVPL
jgi:hypothetical protein